MAMFGYDTAGLLNEVMYYELDSGAKEADNLSGENGRRGEWIISSSLGFVLDAPFFSFIHHWVIWVSK